MLEARAIEFREGAELPGHRAVADAVRAALPALAPVSRITVPEAAARRMVEAGGQWVPWRNDVAPYMVEPAEQITSRLYDSVAFIGPARSAKTEALVKNPIAHMILANPRLVHLVHMSADSAREWSVEELDKLLRNSPELAARKARGKGADNLLDKRFIGGGRLTVGYPVVRQLSARSIPLVLITDADRMPQDIGGEGSVFALGRKRTQSAGSRGMTVIEASPGFPILDESWTPATPHQAPPCEGIVGIYNQGTRGRWYLRCPDCHLEFEPSLERLHWPNHGTPAERGRAAAMVCLHCGSVIEARHKAELNRAGRWLHETRDGGVAPLGEDTREAATVSYWLKGPAAAFASWSQVVARILEGEELFAATGDESTLKAATNVDGGEPYLPRAKGVAAGLSAAGLRDRASEHAWKTCPAGTRFVTVAVDVQAGRFVVQVEAWRDGLDRVLVDRFDLVTPPEGAARAEERALDPARFPEDWDVLLALATRAWPVVGEDYALRPCGVIVDAGGAPGVTPNAYAFYRKARRIARGLFHLVRGRGGEKVKRAEAANPETAHKGKRHVAKDITLVWAGTDRLKGEVAASLTRGEEGGRALLLPRGAPADVFGEYSAERPDANGRWEKKPGVRRNEALDLSVYALALVIVLGAERIQWHRPPHWARADASNTFATLSAPEPEGEPETEPEPEAPPVKARRRPRRGKTNLTGW